MSGDEGWVFDSLICFLHSPAWNAALNTFIEEKSLTFDPNITIDITNPEYISIHNEYKNLVDFMLGSFMEEMNITPEQFEVACLEGRSLNILPKDEPTDNHTFSFHRGLFQQIWAANDIRIFVRLMVQRNVEIQLQALDLIERRQASLQDSENGENPTEIEEEKEIEKFVESEISPDKNINNESTSDKSQSEGGDRKQLENSEEDKFQRLNLFFEKERIKSTDVSERQEYFRAQRDKILQIKKQARARQLNEMTKERPTSARAAKKVLEGEKIAADESSMAVRKLLAKRLREEVVNTETD